MERARTVATVIAGAWSFALALSLVVRYATDWRGTGPLIAIGVAALIGAAAGLDRAREAKPLSPRDRRDAWVWLATIGATLVLIGVVAAVDALG